MAAKIAASPDLTLAVGLAEVQPALEAWRQGRRHREAIPEKLWGLIAGLEWLAQLLNRHDEFQSRGTWISRELFCGNALSSFVVELVVRSQDLDRLHAFRFSIVHAPILATGGGQRLSKIRIVWLGL